MQHGPFTIIAPALQAPSHSEAQTLGAVVWLWLQAQSHRNTPLHALTTLLLPALRSGQFILALADQPHTSVQTRTPVGYLAWACLCAQAESRYVHRPASAMREADWCSGDRMWFTDWLTPFGHTQAFGAAVQQLLPHAFARALHHRGDERGLRVQHFRGRHTTKAQAQQWWQARPILAQAPPPSAPSFEATQQVAVSVPMPVTTDPRP
jgi:cytolysin-activating lysine-acyltransferase